MNGFEHGSQAWHSARAAERLRDKINYQTRKDASDQQAAISTLAKSLNDARASCTGLNFTIWDEYAAAEMVYAWICQQAPQPR